MTTPFITLTATMATNPTGATEPELDFESIKALMDGFDPATLLPDLSKVFGSLVTVCKFAVMVGPVILLALGLAYLLIAPKEANYYFGYRCYYGMGSVQAWRFTQRVAGLLLGLLGLVLTIVMWMISGSFASMEVTDMVRKAVSCLVWEAVLVVLVTLAINFIAAACFNRKGELRRKKKGGAPKQKKPKEA